MALNLFPARAPIGRITGPDGREIDVLMTPEFSRALSDLLVRVGGPTGMSSDDIVLLASDSLAQVPFSAQMDDPKLLEVVDLAPQVAALQAKVEQLQLMVSDISDTAAQINQLSKYAQGIEILANTVAPAFTDWEHPGKIGDKTANTGAFLALIATTITGTDATDATSSIAAAVKTAGGLAVAKKLFVGTLLDLSTATAGQVKFPAAQNASADANTLDDYEEGTWTVTPTNLTVVNGTGGATYSGRYTKIGNLCFFSVAITVSGTCTTASTANSTYVNLPFTPAYASVCAAVDGNVVSLGNGQLWTNGNAYLPTWSSRNVRVDISGVFAV